MTCWPFFFDYRWTLGFKRRCHPEGSHKTDPETACLLTLHLSHGGLAQLWGLRKAPLSQSPVPHLWDEPPKYLESHSEGRKCLGLCSWEKGWEMAPLFSLSYNVSFYRVHL